MALKETHKYDDIIHLSRPVSRKHPPMALEDRGAQFSPFAALVGYEAVLRETSRLTEAETVLDESGKELLDRKLRWIEENLESAREITFLCFAPDARKMGGSFVPIRGRVKKIDLYRGKILLEDGRECEIERIREIDGVDEYGNLEHSNHPQQP